MSMTGRSIVIIEDDLILALFMTATLEGVLYSVFHTADLDEGFRLACTHRPAAVILDLTLNGVRSDGVYRKLQSDPRTSGIPIIICTVHRDFTVRRCLHAAPTYSLYKPFHVLELLETVEFARRSPPRAASSTRGADEQSGGAAG